MTNCCAPQAGTQSCPDCGQKSKHVSAITLSFILKYPLNQNLTEDAYYFCSQPGCETVYFSARQSFQQQHLRITIGQKSTHPDRLICYCYGISQQQAQSQPNCVDFVQQQTQQGHCQCEAHNPSGRCCLKQLKNAAQKQL